MRLLARLLRSLWIFGFIFASYVLQLGLERAFRRVPAWLEARRRRVDLANAKRLLRGILRLRGVYIKLGQVLSIMGGFLPRAFTNELQVLQDRVPPRPFREFRAAFRESTGRDPSACFESIDDVPLAAASLGQVHRCTLHDGRVVAVKFLYPGIRDVIRTDMKVVRLAMRAYQWFVPVQNLQAAHAALVDLLKRETDYEHEARCMERMAENHAGSADLVFPVPLHELTTKDVLTMTYVDGIKITDFEELDANRVDRKRIATRLTQWFYESIFVHRLFHADPHPGNFLIQPGTEPRIVVLDFGAISETSADTVDGMVDVLQGFFEQNDSLVLRGFGRLGFVAEHGNRELVEQTVRTYFQKLLKVQDRSAGALMQARAEDLTNLADPEIERRRLRELMRSIRYPDGWFYVERAAVLAFWLVGQIDPGIDTMQVGFPYILPLLAQRTRSVAPGMQPTAQAHAESQ